MKINQDCELNIRELGKRVMEISTIYDNKFIRKIFIGYTLENAEKKFLEELKK